MIRSIAAIGILALLSSSVASADTVSRDERRMTRQELYGQKPCLTFGPHEDNQTQLLNYEGAGVIQEIYYVWRDEVVFVVEGCSSPTPDVNAVNAPDYEYAVWAHNTEWSMRRSVETMAEIQAIPGIPPEIVIASPITECDPKDDIFVRVYALSGRLSITVDGTYGDGPPPGVDGDEDPPEPDDDGSVDAGDDSPPTPPPRPGHLPDSDEDGRMDSVDECPNTPGEEAFDGCPEPDATPDPSGNEPPVIVVVPLDEEPELDESHRRFELSPGVTVFAVPGQVVAGTSVKAKWYLSRDGRWYAFGVATVGYDMEDRDPHNVTDAAHHGHPEPSTADDFDLALALEIGFGIELGPHVYFEIGIMGAASPSERTYHSDQRSLMATAGFCLELGRFKNTQLCIKAAAGVSAFPTGNGESELMFVAGPLVSGHHTARTAEQRAIGRAEREARKDARRLRRDTRRVGS